MAGKINALLRMAGRNVLRNRRRTALSATAIALAVAFVWLSAALTVGMLERTVRNATDGFLGHVQIHAKAYTEDPQLSATLPDSLAVVVEDEARKAGLDLAVAPRIYAEAYASVGELGSGVMLVGIDPRAEAAASGLADDVVDGSYLRPGADDQVVLGEKLAKRLEVGIGDQVELTVSTAAGIPAMGRFEIAGTVATGLVEFDDSAAFVELGRAQELTGIGPAIHELGLRGPDADSAAVVADLVREPVVARDPQAVVETWREVSPDIALWVDVAAGTFEGFAFVLVLVVGAAILLSQSMTVFERRVELGLLRAIGLRPRQLLLLLVLESSFVAGVGALLGLGLGGLALAVMTRTGLDLGGGAELEMSGVSISPVVYPSVDFAIPIQTLVVTVLLAAIASLFAGARTAVRGPMGVIHDG